MIDEDILPHQMNAAQWARYCEELFGLPPPAREAPIEETYKWGVAGMFLSTCREIGDPVEGKLLVTNFLLRDPPTELSKLLPYIEAALGRKLSAQEIERGAIEEV